MLSFRASIQEICYHFFFINFSSFSFHSLYFSSITQLLMFVRSYSILSFVSLGFMNSLMSSSHLLLGLPRYTRRRFERTHGDVWSGHTGFSACHTPHTTPHTHHKTLHTTTHNTTTRQQHFTTTETDRDRDRQRQREKRREKRGKRREKIHFQCGGALAFFVHGVLCFVKPVNARFIIDFFQCPLASQQFF